MNLDRNLLAIITARGGSKGVHRKNIRSVCGKPLIAYSLQAALDSEKISRTIVSTDDQHIADIALGLGGEVPFLRPGELARDESSSIDVLIYTLEWLRRLENYQPELTLLIQPTSPLVRVADIEEILKVFDETEADAVVSVCEAHPSPYWMHRIESDGRLVDFFETQLESRRQDIPPVYQRNGALWLAKTKVLIDQKSFIGDKTYAYLMGRERSLEIDSEIDLVLAEYLLSLGE